MDDIQKLRIYYGALNGFLGALSSSDSAVTNRMAQDYQHIFEKIAEIVEIDLTYLAPNTLKFSDYSYSDGMRDMRVERIELVSKAKQLRGILESGYNVSDKIVQIGSLFNAIKDEELRSRCGDLLVANGHFDRVINQATQILETRIQSKSGSKKIGKQLVNDVIKPDFKSTVLIMSKNPGEHEGYSFIFRGVMQTLRNSTHHSLSENYTREDAFAICGYIDQLLTIIERSSIVQ